VMFMNASAAAPIAHGDDVHVGVVIAPAPTAPVAVYGTSAFAHFAAMLCLAATLVLMFLPGWALERV